MGLFDFLRRARPAVVKAPAVEVKSERDPEAATQAVLELLRPHLMPACYGILQDGSTADLPITASKAGGEPYAEEGDTWPISESSGTPMLFAFQVNSTDLPIDVRFPSGLVVIFADREEMENCDLHADNGPLRRRHYPNPSASKYVMLAREQNAERTEGSGGRRVVFQAGLSLPDADTVLALDYREKYAAISEWRRVVDEWSDPFREATARLIGPQVYETFLQIGGHPQWVQCAEPPDGERLPHENFILQMNSVMDLWELIWGDLGSIYIYADADAGSLDLRHSIFQCS